MLPHAEHLSDPGQTTHRRRPVVLAPWTYALAAPLLALILPVSHEDASAQSPRSPVTIEFDHDGRDVDGFALYATRLEDGMRRRIDVGRARRTASGRLQVEVPALQKGTWRLELAAYNAAGESPRARADPLDVHFDPDAAGRPPVVSAPVDRGRVTAPAATNSGSTASKKGKKKGTVRKLWSLIVGDDQP